MMADDDVVGSAAAGAEVEPDTASSYRPHTGTLDFEDPASTVVTPVPQSAPEAPLESAAAVTPVARATPRRVQRPPVVERRRPARIAGWVAAAAAVIAAGVGVSGLAGTKTDVPAAPGSTAGPDRAAIAAAERVLGDARISIARRDFDYALALLDRASELIDGIGDPVEERRLRAEVERLRGQTFDTAPTPSESVAVRPAPVQATTTVTRVKTTKPAEPPQVTTTTTSSTSRRGLPTLLPSVIPTFPKSTRTR